MAHTQSINIIPFVFRHATTPPSKGGWGVSAILLLLLAVMPLHAQQWHTTIEISHPAALRAPEHVHELLLVNNVVPHPDAPMGAFFTLMAAAEMLEGSDYLPAVLETTQNTSVSLYRKQLLSVAQADSLLNTYSSDGLLVLNQLIVHPTTEEFVTTNDTYYSSIRAIVATHWTFYCRPTAVAQEIIGNHWTLADTLYWESEDLSPESARSALPTLDQVNNEMFVYAGERIAQRLLPSIETADRYLYDLGKDDVGMYYFTRKQWEQAIEAWSNVHTDKRAEAYAAANSAVTYEILGDLTAAYAAAERAMNLFSELRSADARQQAVNMRYYLEQLQRFPRKD